MNIRRRAILTNAAESDFIIMTSATNPKILKILHDAGLCASATEMYKSEAEAVRNEDLSISDVYNGSLFYQKGGAKDEDFSAFQYFTGVTDLPSYCFGVCNLANIVLPETIKTADYRALAGNKFTYIEIPEGFVELADTQIFNYSATATPTSIYFKSKIPPTLKASSGFFCFGYIEGISAIYVPNDAVNTYKAAWADARIAQTHADSVDEWLALIKPISEYQQN